MNFALMLQVAAILLSIMALTVAIATFARAGRWKDGSDAKELLTEVGAIDKRLTTVEAEMKGLATKADIASLSAKLDGVRELVVRAENAVERVEHIMMEKDR